MGKKIKLFGRIFIFRFALILPFPLLPSSSSEKSEISLEKWNLISNIIPFSEATDILITTDELLFSTPSFLENEVEENLSHFHNLFAVSPCALTHPIIVQNHFKQNFLHVIMCDQNITERFLLDVIKYKDDSNNSFILLIFNNITIDALRPLPIYETIKRMPVKMNLLVGFIEKNEAEIFRIYKPTNDGSVLIRKYLEITYEKKIAKIVVNADEIPLLSEKCRSNLNKNVLRIAGVMDPIYSFDTNIVQHGNLTYEFRDSFAVEVLRALELTINFRSVIVVTNAWGHLVNETWFGMISLLLEDKADLAVSSTADRPFRRVAVDFNIPTNDIRLSAFFRRPPQGKSIDALAAPFAPIFWLSILIWITVLALTLIIIKAIYQWAEIANEELWSPRDCFQFSLSTLCLQGFYKIPSKMTYRIPIAVGSLAGIVICTAYSGTLVSFISVSIESINNLEQLIEEDYEFSFIDNNPLPLKFFEESPIKSVQKIYSRRLIVPTFELMGNAKSELVKGSFVVIIDHMSGYESLVSDFTTIEACQMKEVVVPNGEQKQGTMVPKNSPYKRIIDYQILRFWEHGLVKKWSTKYLQGKPKCDSLKTEYEGVSLESVSLSLFALSMGMILALVFLAVERFMTVLPMPIQRNEKK